MPVQFIGGSSGGTTDVRTTFAAPVLNDALANTTTIVAQYEIPANYLTTNDLLNIKYIAQFSSGNSGVVPINFYLGSTGTTSDTLITVDSVNIPVYRLAASNFGQVYLNASIYFYSVGASGLATARFDSTTKTSSTTGGISTTYGLNTNNATVNTTQKLYISLVAVTPTTAAIDTLGSYITVGY